MSRPRQTATVFHRYTGLTIAGFIALTGLTGAIIAWNDQLERVFAPAMFILAPDAARRPPLETFALRDKVERESGFAINGVDWDRAPGSPAIFAIEGDPGGPAPHDDEIAVDPSTGQILGSRRYGDISQGLVNLIPFIYELHKSLALGDSGRIILGIAAMLWTLDCFVGAYLTFPARTNDQKKLAAWFDRWKPAWTIRRPGSRFKLFYDLHRAGGLWPWALLFILAWSSVSFNLPQLYYPVTKAALGTESSSYIMRRANPAIPPLIEWREAHHRGQELMAGLARRERLRVLSERFLSYDPTAHVYVYRVRSDRDPGATGNTQVRFDGDTGQLADEMVPTGRVAGTTLTSWIENIHTGDVFGLGMRIVLSLAGIAAASLSITGVWLWWRKRTARSTQTRRRSSRTA